MKSRAKSILLISAAALATAGCSVFDSSRNENLVYVARPVEQLYNNASDALTGRRYDQAVLLYDEVERQHPYSEWASRSNIMSAFANYQARNYEEAINAARRYISLHPGNDETVYAYYLIGICYFEQIVDVGRDQGITENAYAAFDDVVRRYPETEYAADARLKMDMIQDQLAGKEMEIGRWYLRRNQHLAAINRFREVVDEYQTTSHTPEALYRLTEAYLSIGLESEAMTAASVLGYNYPTTEWYADAYALMEDTGNTPGAEPESNRRGFFGLF
ncbi:outer membrane protein assembly factor BamD [Ponticaulis sp.]|uniref:outer membrane protein assembly factor BamD n=1 Tax=Ponticaulis sp. TaxID=2020902 RepID=UPI000B6E3B9D|nr:outer membrane protein assembly factor BamD [Ponticaulis sp.]MAJ08982.1 outer membrane protein assembly factor BamD [Ponticaulis sp.]RPG16777.1 MAG: outer membrane protein assembly factor BamD [Hyphomonadaceae bacterium TMED125]HBJ91607.1 outer membrane protein assembly factor BamD [Hyphomonadaceae bacterium]|tara:strand:+ start:82585 stop:83409 length:825 start_codon:yes stop_codon:yes gene_type:complete